MSGKVLITGGAGYIGSHTYVALREAGFACLILDNFSNSSARVLERLERITGARVDVVDADIHDAKALDALLMGGDIDSVIHFAGWKAVGESSQRPLKYYDNNVCGTVNLLKSMQRCRVTKLVFSSSATVYAQEASMPLIESSPRAATSPYGRTKLMVEEILGDLCHTDPSWRIAALRYFNPVGAHASGLIGEDPTGTPNNLVPFIAQVAIGRRERLTIFGDDYPTADGTGVRDYVHVLDVAEGHVAALRYLADNPGLINVNLGTGRGTSVLEMLRQYELACGRAIPFAIAARRQGDVASCWADIAKAREFLRWQATRSIAEMCADSWRWQQLNPDGYR